MKLGSVSGSETNCQRPPAVNGRHQFRSPTVRDDFIVVGGCRIRYRRLDSHRKALPVLLIHGAGAHAGWWQAVVPYLGQFRDVVMIELSGHGDSGHRDDDYGLSTWAQEIRAVIDELDAREVALVGHSMGGLVALYAAAMFPDVVRAVIAIDSAIIPHPPRPGGSRVVKFYASQDEGIKNFRLRPRATCAAHRLLVDVARGGLREEQNGWRWKFDPSTMHRIPRDVLNAAIAKIECSVGFIYGAASEIANLSAVERLAEMLGRPVPNIVVPRAYHHVPLDAPARTAAAIEILLSEPITGCSEITH